MVKITIQDSEEANTNTIPYTANFIEDCERANIMLSEGKSILAMYHILANLKEICLVLQDIRR